MYILAPLLDFQKSRITLSGCSLFHIYTYTLIIKLFTLYICHMNGSVEPKSQDTPNGSAVLVGDQHDGGSAELGEEQLSDDR